jgi:hypothetical protein
MDRVENTNSDNDTKSSNLSSWTGPVARTDESNQMVRNDNLAPFDSIDWAARLFSVAEVISGPFGIQVGPTLVPASRNSFPINGLFANSDILAYACKKYAFCSWDAIDVRFTVSDPKNLVGGMFLGWWPYADWYNMTAKENMNTIMDSDLLVQGLINGPYSHFMLYGMSEDVEISIPWSFKYPVLDTYRLFILSASNQANYYGMPVLWWYQADHSAYVTSVTNPALLNIFVKFRNLRWFGPTNDADITPPGAFKVSPQSGLVAEAGLALAAAGVAAVTENIVDTFVPKEDISEYAEPGTFDLPQAVQMAYFGDTTSCGFPNTAPIFKTSKSANYGSTPTVLEMLQRPQYIATIRTDTDDALIGNDPMSFQWDEGLGAGTRYNKATYFRFFGMLNRYWRGTVICDIVVAGHPMIQVQLDARVSYPRYTSNVDGTVMSQIFRHLSTFPGSKMVSVPLPYLTKSDYMSINDEFPGSDVRPLMSTTQLSVSARIVSTMLDVAPTIPVYLFMRAAPDFAFYQPYPCGLYRVNELSVESQQKRAVKRSSKGKRKAKAPGPVDLQVFLPFDSPEIAQSRYSVTSDPGTMINLPTVYDYMKIWSRAIPFKEYDDNEPVPDANVGFKSASWFPPKVGALDEDSLNSWYQTVDYIALLSTPFMYYQGEIAFKISVCTDSEVRDQGSYVYAALAGPENVGRQETHTEFQYSDAQVPPNSNFGTGTVITPQSLQPILEGTIPYRGTNVWSFTNNSLYYRGPGASPPWDTSADGYEPGNADVLHNIVLNDDIVLADAMFRKIGKDFVLGLETILPPPTMWIAKGGPWERP